MEQTSTITRAVIVTSVVAIVAALATGLAVVTAGIGPAIPLAILFALVVVIYHHQHRLPARDPARACRDGNGLGQLWRRTRRHRQPHSGPGTRPTS